MKQKTKWKRNCPKCGKNLDTNNSSYYYFTLRNNTLCKSCSKKGKCPWNKGKVGLQKSPYKGKTWVDIYGKEESSKKKKNLQIKCGKGKSLEDILGKEKAEESRKKNSISHKGEKNSFFGKKHSQESNQKNREKHLGKIHSKETKFKIRKKILEKIKNNLKNGYQILPFYNSKACKLMDEYGKENGYNFQHAMNGGEYFISELGYWVDGVDHDKKTIIEYYERHHKSKEKKDEQRINEIKKFMKYKIIILREWTDNIEFV
jgi:very-short-patch-repair endonuclease